MSGVAIRVLLGISIPIVVYVGIKLFDMFTTTTDHHYTPYLNNNYSPKYCERCTICLEDFKTCEENLKTLSCGHRFHWKCFKKWLEEGQKRCPVCRSSF